MTQTTYSFSRLCYVSYKKKKMHNYMFVKGQNKKKQKKQKRLNLLNEFAGETFVKLVSGSRNSHSVSTE